MFKIIVTIAVILLIIIVMKSGSHARYEKAEIAFIKDGMPCEQINFYAQYYYLNKEHRKKLRLIGKCD